MGKTLIRVDCVDQRLYISTAPMLASGGRNEDEIEFGFCSLWDGFEKTAVFYREKDDVYHAIITDDRCIIPHEVLTDEGWMYFGVLGVKGDITRTSAIMRYRIEAGAITEGTNPSDPTPDIYAQYIARIQAIERMFTSEPFSVTGNPVEIDNYGSAPMHVKTTVALNQSGEGDPSSDNPRPISVVDRFILSHTGADSENKHMSAPVGNMAEGTFDFSTGQMVTTVVWQEFDGSADENIVKYERENLPYGFRFECKFNLTANTSKRDQSRCNRAKYVINLLPNFQRDTYSISSEGDRIVYMPPEAAGNTVDSFRAWLAENPLQIAYIPAEIITVNKVPTPIYAFDGLNTISVNHGTLTVEGEKSLPAAVGGLSERVTELEEMGGVNGSWVAGVSSIEGKDGDLTLDDIGAARKFEVGEGLTMVDGVLSANEGVYELIETISPQGLTSILRTYNLTDVQIYLKTVKQTTIPTRLTVNVSCEDGSTTAFLATDCFSTEGDRCSRFCVTDEKHIKKAYYIPPVSGFAVQSTVQEAPVVTQAKAITGIRLTVVGAAFPEGTEIEVWGVRVNAEN